MALVDGEGAGPFERVLFPGSLEVAGHQASEGQPVRERFLLADTLARNDHLPFPIVVLGNPILGAPPGRPASARVTYRWQMHHIGSSTGEVAEKLVKDVPCFERASFMNSGTEVVQLAIRLARAYAKKNVILKFEGAYHGWVDSVAHSVHPSLGTHGPVKVQEKQTNPEMLCC